MSVIVPNGYEARLREEARIRRAKFFPTVIRTIPPARRQHPSVFPLVEQSLLHDMKAEGPPVNPDFSIPDPDPGYRPETTMEELEALLAAVLNSLFPQAREYTRPAAVLPGDIIRRTAAEFGTSVTEIRSETRSKGITEARHHAIWRVSVSRPDLSLPSIGLLFGGRDHTTIIHAIRRVERLLCELPHAEYLSAVLQWSNFTGEEALRCKAVGILAFRREWADAEKIRIKAARLAAAALRREELAREKAALQAAALAKLPPALRRPQANSSGRVRNVRA